eukprot:Skav226338  [mRNA]  locus=scaffold3640:56391:60839:+ [translate_table: standard]
MERKAAAIDLDGDDDDLVVSDGALVPVDSPSKRPKTNMLLPSSSVDRSELLQLIQSTIQDTISSSLGAINTTMQTLAEKSASQESRLGKVEQALKTQQGMIQEKDSRQNKRIDDLQKEFRELQKHLCSPRGSPRQSPSGSPTSSANPNPSEPKFDIVVGGWKEGVTREWVETQVSKFLASTGVTDTVSQIKTFGKRPTFAKLELHFENGLALAQRREIQMDMIKKLKAAGWQPHDRPVWVTGDKTPQQRRVSKAVAVLNGFLRHLQVDHGMLEVSSWPSAKAYVGEHRVTGLSQDHSLGSRPLCDACDVRWIVCDDRTGTNVWLDTAGLALGLNLDKAELQKAWQTHLGATVAEGALEAPDDEFASALSMELLQVGTWNVQGKPAATAIDVCHDFGLDFHVLALQEVGGSNRQTPGVPFHMEECAGYMVLTACPVGCFRPLALALDSDCVSHWSSGTLGHSHALVVVSLPGFLEKVCVVCVHLPHSGRPHDDFLAALTSLEESLKPFVLRRSPICLLGDLNVDLDRDHGVRQSALLAFLQSLDLGSWSVDAFPTWKDRRLDHVVCNPWFVRRCQHFAAQHACSWASVQVRADLQAALGSDHGLLCHDILTAAPVDSHRARPSHRALFARRPCRMRVRDVSLLQQHVYGVMDSCASGSCPDPHAFLSSCAAACSSRAPVFGFRDSAALKALCRSRSVTMDPARRCQLSLEIHRLRAHERKQWKAGLMASAAKGDWEARRFLQKRACPHVDFAARRAHVSWFSVECIAALRHGVKMWIHAFSTSWDILLAQMVWAWVGHVLRMAPGHLVRQVLLSLQSVTAEQHRLRRCRTGPDNTGHRSVLRYMSHKGITTEMAHDRARWTALTDDWLQHHGLHPNRAHMNVFLASADSYFWHRCCLQGSFHGQQVVFCELLRGTFLELDRVLGWRTCRTQRQDSATVLVQNTWATGWIRPTTFHLRIFVFSAAEDFAVDSCILHALPLYVDCCFHAKVVVEVSSLPVKWFHRMKLLADELGG